VELLQNSVDAAPATDRLCVEIAVEAEPEEWVRITYRDNGPGIPSEYKQRVFEDFFSRRPGRKTGVGLGLSQVRRVVEAHSGTIVESGFPGQGVEFVIGMPRFSEVSRGEEALVSHSRS